jgi:hypothetical protein
LALPDENRQRILDAVGAFNRGDLERYLSSYAGDAVIHGLPGAVDPSPTGLRSSLEALRAGLPDLQVMIMERTHDPPPGSPRADHGALDL